MTRAFRLLAGLAVAGALAAVSPAYAQTVSDAADAVAASPRVERAQERIATAQAQADAASARLAEARARLAAAAPEDAPARRRDVERWEAVKDLRVQSVHESAESAAQIAREEADAAAKDAAVLDEPAPQAQESLTGIVLAPQAAATASATATAPAAAPASPVAASPAVTTSPDAAAIDAFLASKGSPLTGLGAVFVAEGDAVGLDPRMLVAIAGAETAFGTYGPSQGIHNPFGLGPGMQFATWADAIRYAARNLAGPLYRGAGHVTIPAINAVWAPAGASNDPTNLNSHWSGNVSTYYAALGGDPSGSVFTGVAAPAADAAAAMPFAPSGGLAAATVTNTGPKAAEDALTMLGTPNAADADGGLDDMGLVRAVYQAQGVELPDRPNAVGVAGVSVSPDQLRPGDILLFGGPDTGNDVTHMGLYAGGGVFVHAPGAGDVVRLASLYDAAWANAYLGARRV